MPKLVLLRASLANFLISGAHALKKPRSTCIGVSTRKPSISVDAMRALAAAMCFARTRGLSVRRSSSFPYIFPKLSRLHAHAHEGSGEKEPQRGAWRL